VDNVEVVAREVVAAAEVTPSAKGKADKAERKKKKRARAVE
jgi:hypothetical protein